MDIQKARDEIIIAYLFLRKHKDIISSESLAFMKKAADEKLEQLSLTAVVQAKPEKVFGCRICGETDINNQNVCGICREEGF